MISELYKAIAEGLKEVKNCRVYREDVPQNFKVPSFMVTIYDPVSYTHLTLPTNYSV